MNRTVRWGGGGGPKTGGSGGAVVDVDGVVAYDDDASDRDPADLGRREPILPIR